MQAQSIQLILVDEINHEESHERRSILGMHMERLRSNPCVFTVGGIANVTREFVATVGAMDILNMALREYFTNVDFFN